MIKNTHGQATIEAAVSGLLIVGLLIIFISICYLGYLKITVDHVLHETLVCKLTLSLRTTGPSCEQKLKDRLGQKIIHLRVVSLKIKKRRSYISGDLSLSSFQNIPLSYYKSIDLPLEASK